MLKNRWNLNQNHIFRTLWKIFKKLHRFKFDSRNLHILFLSALFFNLKKGFFSEKKNLLAIKSKKYYYYLYFILFKKFIDDYLNLKKINNNLDLDRIILSLNHKNNLLYLYLENSSSRNNTFREIKYDFFFKFKKSFIYLEENYKFRIDIFDFLFYGKYIEYIRKSAYNEYLTFTAVLWDYPLLKTFLRLIIYHRLGKIQDHELSFSSNPAILKKYQIYDDFDYLKIFKSQRRLASNQSLFLLTNLINTYSIKSLIILKNKRFINYLDWLFFKFFKSNVILPAYYINLNYEEEDDITDTNRLNMMGLYSLYWQMNRYGFDFNYYYYLKSLVNCSQNSSLNNITIYNIYFLKFILVNNFQGYWIFWYKLMKLILLDFIYGVFFKFFKFNRLNLKRKQLRFRRLLSFKLLMQTYSFIFLPLDMRLYYNDLDLWKNIKEKKACLDGAIVDIFFGHNFNLLDDLNFNLNNIYRKINLDSLLFSNFDYYLNLFIFFLSKKIGKYFFTNIFSQYKGLELFLKKILNFTNFFDNYSNYYLSRDIQNLKIFKYLDFSFSKYRGINYFFFYRNRFLEEYLWDFEFYMIYSFYLIVLYKYNQLYLKIFIGKFLLFGNK